MCSMYYVCCTVQSKRLNKQNKTKRSGGQRATVITSLLQSNMSVCLLAKCIFIPSPSVSDQRPLFFGPAWSDLSNRCRCILLWFNHRVRVGNHTRLGITGWRYPPISCQLSRRAGVRRLGSRFQIGLFPRLTAWTCPLSAYWRVCVCVCGMSDSLVY